MNRTTLLTLAAGTAIAVLVSGGVAVASGKITSRQIARNAVLSKHLKAGAVRESDLADGAVTGPKVANGAVTGPKLAPNTVTGAQVDESTLATVPNATAVGGIKVVPIQLSLPDTASGLNPFFSTPNVALFGSCTTVTGFEVDRTGPLPVTLESNRATFGTGMVNLSGGLGQGADAANYTVTVFGPGTQTTVIRVAAVHSTDAFGGTDDCFFRGTVTSTP
jgi:hypothetical protein